MTADNLHGRHSHDDESIFTRQDEERLMKTWIQRYVIDIANQRDSIAGLAVEQTLHLCDLQYQKDTIIDELAEMSVAQEERFRKGEVVRDEKVELRREEIRLNWRATELASQKGAFENDINKTRSVDDKLYDQVAKDIQDSVIGYASLEGETIVSSIKRFRELMKQQVSLSKTSKPTNRERDFGA